MQDRTVQQLSDDGVLHTGVALGIMLFYYCFYMYLGTHLLAKNTIYFNETQNSK